MKKILFIEPHNGKISGAQKVTLNIAKIFHNRKDYVTVLYPGDESGALIKGYKPFCNKIDYYELPTGLGSGGFDGLSIIKKLSVIISSLIKLSFFYFKQAYRCRRENYDYIYTYDPRGVFIALPIAVFSNKKLIWHIHGKFLYKTFVFRFLSFFCYKIFTPSNSIKEQLPSSPKIHVVYNGFEFGKTIIKSPLIKKDVDNIKILFVGVLTPQKGIHLLLDSMVLYKGHREIELTIIGDILDSRWEWFSELLRAKIRLLPENVRVISLGWVSEPLQFYSNHDFLIFPSQHSCSILKDNVLEQFWGTEALPTVLIEAQAMGLPVIANDVPGVREIVQKNGGVICNMNTPEDILASILYALKNSQELKVNPDVTRNKFSFNLMNDRINNLLP